MISGAIRSSLQHMKKKYQVTLVRKGFATINVEAEDSLEAENKVLDEYNDGRIELDYGEYSDIEVTTEIVG